MTIFDFAPRNITDKSFYLPYKIPLEKIQHTICHEMLHFIFYYYFYKHFRNKRITRKQLWRLSEIFNEVVLDSEFRDICQFRKEFPKKEKNILQNYKLMWKESRGTDDFILKLMKHLNF